MALSFAFNAQTTTPAMLAERRRRADLLAYQIGSNAPSYGGGIGDLFRGIGAGLSRYRTNLAEQQGNASGRSAVDSLMGVLSAPPGVPGLASPSDPAIRSGVVDALRTGQAPQLTTYVPPRPAQQPAPAAQPSSNQAPYPGADGITSADQGGTFTPDTAGGGDPVAQAVAVPQAPIPVGNDTSMLNKIDQVLRNPWVSENDKAVLLERRKAIAQRLDPEYQMKLKTEQLSYDQAAHPENVPMTALQQQQLKNSQLSYDQTLHPDQIPMTALQQAQLAALKAKPQGPEAIQEYEYAKSHGFNGSIADYENAKAGRSVGTTSVPDLPQVQVDAAGNVDKTSQDALLGSLPPDDARAVKGMIDYRLDPTKFASMRGNERQRLVDLATAADPTFDLSQFKARQAFKQSLTSGNLSQALMSSNLVVQHMDALLEAADKMANGNYPMINRAGNLVKTQTGQNAVTNFNTAKKAVAAELAKVFKGVGATDVNSINEWESNFDQNSSPEQIKGAVETATKLLASRIDTVKNQYQSTMGRPMDFRFLTPKTEAVLARRGLDVGAGVPGAPPPDAGASAPSTIIQYDAQGNRVQ